MIKIRQLQALDTIVRCGSFVEAAGRLHVTPAALSLSIRELEQQLAFKVLERTTRSLRLTEAGRGYLPFVQQALKALEDAEHYVREVQQGRGLVRIATTQTIIATLLVAALPELTRRWPTVGFHPIDVAAGSIADALVARQADLAIGVGLPHDDHFAAQPFFASRWLAYVAASHGLFGRRKKVGWHELAQTRLFMNKSSALAQRAAFGDDFDPANVHDTMTASAGLAMAATGSGVAVFPGYVQPLARMAGLRVLPIERPALVHELQIAAARRPATVAPLEAIRQQLITAVAKRCAHLR